MRVFYAPPRRIHKTETWYGTAGVLMTQILELSLMSIFFGMNETVIVIHEQVADFRTYIKLMNNEVLVVKTIYKQL
jgi:uncharacterized membrane protein